MEENKKRNTTNKRKRGRPNEKSGIDLNKILNIARKEFSKFGFEGTSINKVSLLCEVNDSLLHYHFGNKEDLWKKAVSRAFDEMESDWEISKAWKQNAEVSFLEEKEKEKK